MKKTGFIQKLRESLIAIDQRLRFSFTVLSMEGYALRNLKDSLIVICSEDDLESLVNAPKVSSLLGNSRILNMDTDCHKILNHRIQSIGSLIFKQALIDVYNRYRWKVDSFFRFMMELCINHR